MAPLRSQTDGRASIAVAKGSRFPTEMTVARCREESLVSHAGMKRTPRKAGLASRPVHVMVLPSMARVRKSELRKKQKGRKRLLLIIAIAAACMLLSLCGAIFGLSWYVGSDGFRQTTEVSLNDVAGSPHAVSLPRNLELSGTELTVPEMQVDLPDGSCRLGLQNARIRVNPWPLLDGCLAVPTTDIERVDLTTDAGIFTLPFSELLSSRRKGAGWAPSSYRIGPLTIRQSNFHFRANDELYCIEKTRFVLRPLQKDFSNWEATFTGGQWKSPYPLLRDTPLHSATLTSKAGLLQLKEARFTSPPGEIRLNATLSTKRKRWTTTARIDKANVERLLVGDWKKRLSGYLYGKVQMQGDLEGFTKAGGDLVLHDGVVTALPVLEKLAWLGDARYRSLPLDKACARFTYPYSENAKNIHRATLIDHIEIESSGLLRIVGRVIIGQGGKLNGNLLVGLPDEAFGRFPAPLAVAFATLFKARGEPGYHWASVNLSGTVDAPQEDFSVRAMNLLTDPDLVSQAGKTALDTLRGALPEGLLPQPPAAPSSAGEPGESAPPPHGGSLIDEAADKAEETLRRGLQTFF